MGSLVSAPQNISHSWGALNPQTLLPPSQSLDQREIPAGISCWRVRSGLWSQDEMTVMLPGTERGLGSPECARCLLTFLSVQGHSPECASHLLSCGHSSQLLQQLLTLHPKPSQHTSPGGRQEAGNARGSRSSPGGMLGGKGCSRRMLGEKEDAQRSRGQAEHPRCRPPSLINYSQIAPNRFHLKSSKAGGRRKAVPDKGGRFDTH